MKLSKRGYQYDQYGFIHKQVVLQKYGLQRIPRGKVIHHLDGNKQNNSPENLVLIPKKVHDKVTWVTRIIREWDEHYRQKKSSSI